MVTGDKVVTASIANLASSAALLLLYALVGCSRCEHPKVHSTALRTANEAHLEVDELFPNGEPKPEPLLTRFLGALPGTVQYQPGRQK